MPRGKHSSTVLAEKNASFDRPCGKKQRRETKNKSNFQKSTFQQVRATEKHIPATKKHILASSSN
jgi:hypothetical protein